MSVRLGVQAARPRVLGKCALAGRVAAFLLAGVFFNAGFKWKLHERCALLAAAGRTIREPRGERAAVFSYLGLQLLF